MSEYFTDSTYIDYEVQAREISEIFEQDSRRYNRALYEEQEAKGI